MERICRLVQEASEENSTPYRMNENITNLTLQNHILIIMYFTVKIYSYYVCV